MALTITQEIPAKTAQIVRRTDVFTVNADPDTTPIIKAHRVKREDGYIKAQTDIVRNLAAVSAEKFGNTSLTIAEAAQAIADTCDRWATEDKEP